MTALSTMLPNAGVAGRVLLRMLDECMRSDLEAALLVLAGMNLDLPGAASASSAVQPEERAKAAWILDKSVKNYLVQAWRMRESQLGRAQVVHGNLAWLPSLDAGNEEASSVRGQILTRRIGMSGWNGGPRTSTTVGGRHIQDETSLLCGRNMRQRCFIGGMMQSCCAEASVTLR